MLGAGERRVGARRAGDDRARGGRLDARRTESHRPGAVDGRRPRHARSACATRSASSPRTSSSRCSTSSPSAGRGDVFPAVARLADAGDRLRRRFSTGLADMLRSQLAVALGGDGAPTSRSAAREALWPNATACRPADLLRMLQRDHRARAALPQERPAATAARDAARPVRAARSRRRDRGVLRELDGTGRCGAVRHRWPDRQRRANRGAPGRRGGRRERAQPRCVRAMPPMRAPPQPRPDTPVAVASRRVSPQLVRPRRHPAWIRATALTRRSGGGQA